MLSSDFTQPDGTAAAPPPPLIGALLRMPFETVRERMLAGLHERGFNDLVAAHLDVFQYPGPENQRPSDLAKRARISKQALNYLLGQIERLGYLERRQDAEDQRVKRVHLTARGRAAVRAIREIVLEVEADWERELGPRRFAALRDLLEQLNAGAAFLAADGYHHHVGLNSWQSEGAATPPDSAPGLRGVEFELADGTALVALQRRLSAFAPGPPAVRSDPEGISLSDPDGDRLVFRSR